MSFLLSFVFLAGCSFFKDKAPDDRVVIKVNDESLTAKEFAEALAERLRVYDALTVKDQKVVRRIKEAVTNDFIVQKISMSYARANNIMVKNEDLEAEVNFVRASFPDDLSFRKSLAEQGLSVKEWTERIKGSILEKLVIRKISESIPDLSNDELKSFYEANKDLFKRPEQFRLNQIVLKSENDADQIIDELKKGRKFEELAREYSITPEAELGVDLGWIERGTYEVFDEASKMPVGQRSKTLKSPHGYHIIELRGKRPEIVLPFEEVKEKIKRRILEKKQQASYSQWLEIELKKAKIFKDQALIDAIQVETKN
ncbi:MAG: peptidyl-prolyl cis-trans isomerase [Bdellovibrionales bacterium]|nr:peptidyl-prolyl cis-trans isomerase [Bdellovibrionales bacterium]